MNTRGIYIDDTKSTLAEFLMRASSGRLLGRTLLALLGLLLAGAIDFGLIIYIMRQGALDWLGKFTGSTWHMVAASCITLALYYLTGLFFERGCRKWAAVCYGIVVGLLCLMLPKMVEPMIQDFWSSFAGGALFGWQHADNAQDAPSWLKLGGTLFFALVCTTPGLLFIYAKIRLWYCLRLWAARKFGLRMQSQYAQADAYGGEARDKAAVRAHFSTPLHGHAAVRGWLRQGVGDFQTIAAGKSHAAAKTLDDVTASKAAKMQAEKNIEAAEQCLDSLKQLQKSVAQIGACLLVGLVLALGTPAQAAEAPRTAQEIVTAAPIFQLLLDASQGSPALNADLMHSAMPLIAQKLRVMPMGTTIIVNSIGNAVLPVLQWRVRIQARKTKDGAPVEDIIHGLQGLLAAFPKQLTGQEHQESHLIGGLFDAAHNINPQSPLNTIAMISDMIENSPLARCGGKGCKLPAPQFKLEGVEVNVYGIGTGLPSDSAIALTQAWEGFFKKTGVKKLQLQRTF
jgi:hypothetical protein